jgi:uncharacterized RmlC-like cupin family protein
MKPDYIRQAEDFAEQHGLDYTPAEEMAGSWYKCSIVYKVGEVAYAHIHIHSSGDMVIYTKEGQRTSWSWDLTPERRLEILSKYLLRKQGE